MSKIVDGYTGKPNIFPDVIGEHNISMYGSGDYVLSVGECLGYELISNNEIHIKDGLFITQGRRGYIEKGTADVCIIENGAQAVNRNDLIIIEYAKDETTMLESHTTKVIKGTAGEEAVDPEIVTGDIPNGAVLHQMPLYRVKIEGLNIVAVEQMFEIGSVAAETVDPMVATEPGFAADAYQTKLQFDEQNKNCPFAFGIDENGNYGYIKDGADAVTPFKKGEWGHVYTNLVHNGSGTNGSTSTVCDLNLTMENDGIFKTICIAKYGSVSSSTFTINGESKSLNTEIEVKKGDVIVLKHILRNVSYGQAYIIVAHIVVLYP